MSSRVLIAGALVGIVLMLSGSAAAVIGSVTDQIMPQVDIIQPELAVQAVGITVDVSGAVLKPGVYELPSGSRMEEAIKMAGGVSPNADTNYLARTINLSQKISDGLKIYIPAQNEVASSAQIGVQSEVGSLIDINSASVDQLDKLPGIGPTTAQNIISKRPYQTINDLVNKKVVSKSVFTKIEKLIIAN